MDLYIYYQAARTDAAAVHDAVARLQQQLRLQVTPLRCGLKRRPRAGELDDGRNSAGTAAAGENAAPAGSPPDTWMEIYLDVAPAFPALLAATVAASPLPALIDGGRHVETFVDALPCA